MISVMCVVRCVRCVMSITWVVIQALKIVDKGTASRGDEDLLAHRAQDFFAEQLDAVLIFATCCVN